MMATPQCKVPRHSSFLETSHLIFTPPRISQVLIRNLFVEPHVYIAQTTGLAGSPPHKGSAAFSLSQLYSNHSLKSSASGPRSSRSFSFTTEGSFLPRWSGPGLLLLPPFAVRPLVLRSVDLMILLLAINWTSARREQHPGLTKNQVGSTRILKPVEEMAGEALTTGESPGFFWISQCANYILWICWLTTLSVHFSFGKLRR